MMRRTLAAVAAARALLAGIAMASPALAASRPITFPSSCCNAGTIGSPYFQNFFCPADPDTGRPCSSIGGSTMRISLRAGIAAAMTVATLGTAGAALANPGSAHPNRPVAVSGLNGCQTNGGGGVGAGNGPNGSSAGAGSNGGEGTPGNSSNDHGLLCE
jgi:hypothetical protein